MDNKQIKEIDFIKLEQKIEKILQLVKRLEQEKQNLQELVNKRETENNNAIEKINIMLDRIDELL
jgi:hypothetical protein